MKTVLFILLMTLIICSCGNPQDYIDIGNTKFDNKDYNGAIMDYTEALELDSDYVIAYWLRGKAKFELKNYLGAIDDFNKAIKLDPRGIYYFERGNAKHEIEDLVGACKDWKEASNLNSGNLDMGGEAAFEENCQPKTPIQKAPIQEVPVKEVPEQISPELIKIRGHVQRSFYFMNSSQYKMDYIYRNNAAFGTNAIMTYDKFFRKYDISFRTETGEVVNFKITDEFFFNDWDFEYKGNTYVFSNSHVRITY